MNSERDDELRAIEELLPWYAAGTLSERDKRRVEQALAREPRLRASLQTVREDIEETIALNQAVAGPRPAALAKIMAAVAAEPRRQGAFARLTAQAERWAAAFSRRAAASPRAFAVAAFAVAIVVIGQGAAIVSLLPHAGANYSTASQESPAAREGAFLLVGFSPDATARQIVDLLQEKKAIIVDGPRSGLFRIRIGDKSMNREQREAALSGWRTEPIVRLALPASERESPDK
jgi:anti-sigma factor RsiW